MLPAATTGLFRLQRRAPTAAAAACRSIASASGRKRLWMRQEEEMRMLEEERRQQEREREQQTEQEGSVLALPHPAGEEGAEERTDEGRDADTKDSGVDIFIGQTCKLPDTG